ncbi:PcfK-like family protein [Flavobacterium collinsii]|uniref:PcfK-like protein n=1 Tax=Flavobacterium collinsii TaxID=1114861 RepID=A0A9W4TI38_9FLAO|nr:PcfK-like family protein [Flavobacterium collinsii]CAI2768655.1 conserved protein of unknown function [Flavobacterium collinsii]
MKASKKFKTAIEKYLNDTAQSNTVFAQNFTKTSKNLESCFNYIFDEVKKTGLCPFENQEIFDMAFKYYTDDSIGTPAPLSCKVVVSQSAQADLFTPASPMAQNVNPTKVQFPKTSNPVQQTLTLFDL